MGMKQIWDGQDLPPEGATVLAQMGSMTTAGNKGGWVKHKVKGFRLAPALEDNPAYHRIFVKLGPHAEDSSSSNNERLLKDIRPVDWDRKE